MPAFKIYLIKIGAESKFDLLSKPWYYRSRFEDWRIVRFWGIYFWIYSKTYGSA